MSDYDPQKRREAYLRTRELKGRTPGSGEESSSSGGLAPKLTSNSTPKKAGIKPVEKEDQRTETEKKIEQMKARLKKLRATIEQLVKEAKARSGVVDTSKASTKTTSSTTAKPDVKLTAKQKADAAKRSKEHYEKNQKKYPEGELGTLQKQIDSAVERIKKLQLTASKHREKQKANTKK